MKGGEGGLAAEIGFQPHSHQKTSGEIMRNIDDVKELIGEIIKAEESTDHYPNIILTYKDGRVIEIDSCWGDYGVSAHEMTP